MAIPPQTPLKVKAKAKVTPTTHTNAHTNSPQRQQPTAVE